MTLIADDTQAQKEIRHILIDGLDLCGCGSINKHEIVRSLLERAESGGSFYEPLGNTLGANAVEFIAHVMSSDKWDLLEHGCGIGASWLTERGELLLRFFREFGHDCKTWPEWWYCGE